MICVLLLHMLSVAVSTRWESCSIVSCFCDVLCQSLDDAEVISASSDGLSTSDGACSCQQSQRNTYTLSAHIAQSG